MVLSAAVCACLLFGAAPPRSKPKPASKAAAQSSKARKSKAASARKKQPAIQQSPDPARIREIQSALAARGYDVEVTGAWGPQSVEALKRFQEDNNINNLTGRGKLDPLTLIALGLGPSRQPAAGSAAAEAPAPDPKQY